MSSTVPAAGADPERLGLKWRKGSSSLRRSLKLRKSQSWPTTPESLVTLLPRQGKSEAERLATRPCTLPAHTSAHTQKPTHPHTHPIHVNLRGHATHSHTHHLPATPLHTPMLHPLHTHLHTLLHLCFCCMRALTHLHAHLDTRAHTHTLHPACPHTHAHAPRDCPAASFPLRTPWKPRRRCHRLSVGFVEDSEFAPLPLPDTPAQPLGPARSRGDQWRA